MGDVLKLELPEKANGLAELVNAVDREKPTVEDQQQLSAYFKDNPHVVDALGNLVHLAQANLIKNSFGLKSVQLSVGAKLQQMRDDMGFKQAGSVERSLIEHVCLCWLRLYDCELRYHMAMQNNPSMKQGKYWEGRLSANQRRYLRSVETLERVRKLMRPDQSPVMNLLLKQQLNVK